MTTRKRRAPPDTLLVQLESVARQLLDSVPGKLDDASLQHVAGLLKIVLDRIDAAQALDDSAPALIVPDDVRERLARLMAAREEKG